MSGRDGNVSIEAGIEATKGMYLSKPLPCPAWSDQASGGVTVSDLPLQDTVNESASVKRIVDVISNVPPPDKIAIETAITAGDCAFLPAPFSPKTNMEVNLIAQFVVLEEDNGNVTVLKHMYSPDLKLGKALVYQLCHGIPCLLKWQGHAMTFRKGFQWFLEQLGGWQRRRYALSAIMTHQQDCQGSKGSYMSSLIEEEVDKGFSYIMEAAGNLQSEWKCVQ